MGDKYYHTRASVEEYISLAKGIDGQEHISALKAFIPEGAKLLEIGSGPGKDWEILNKYFDVVGSDNSEFFLSHLKKEFSSDKFFLLDAVELKIDQTFDGIYSNKVLHHLKNEELEKSVQKQAEILEDDGILCHTFWKGEGSEVFKGMYVNYHSSEDLRSIFGSYFEVLSLEEYGEFENGDSLRLIARKK